MKKWFFCFALFPVIAFAESFEVILDDPPYAAPSGSYDHWSSSVFVEERRGGADDRLYDRSYSSSGRRPGSVFVEEQRRIPDDRSRVSSDHRGSGSIFVKERPMYRDISMDSRRYILEEGAKIGEQVAQWSRMNGWKLIWEPPVDWVVASSVDMGTTDFLEAADTLAKWMQKEGKPVQFFAYEGNRVLVVRYAAGD